MRNKYKEDSCEQIVFAIVKNSKIPLLFNDGNICVYKLKLEENRIVKEEECILTDVKKFRWLSINKIFTVTSNGIIYCIALSEETFSEHFIISYRKPKKGLRILGKKISNEVYNGCEILTTPIKKLKKVFNNIYIIKTKHVYITIW